MKKNRRTLTAFAVAPIGAIAVYTSLLILDPLDNTHNIISSLSLLAWVLLIAYSVEIIFALPLFFVLRPYNLIKPSSCMFSGLLAGLIAGLIADLPVIQLRLNTYYIVACIAGLSSGSVFAFVKFRKAQPGVVADSHACISAL
jgi:hypothetical protein